MAVRLTTSRQQREREESLAWGMRQQTQPSPERIAEEISDAYWDRMLFEDHLEQWG